MARKRLHGVLPIVQVPFTDTDEIDREVLDREVQWGLAQGIDGLGTGMVSESLRLSQAERETLAELLVQSVAGRGAVFLAVTSETTRQAVALARAAERAGCDAVMAAPPVGSRCSETQLFEYFQTIAEAIDLPVVVQDASGYLGQGIPIRLCVALMKQYGPEKILFKPEATPNGPHLSALRDAARGEARIFEGSGGILLMDSFRRGIQGTMPGMEVVDAVVAIWQALQANDEDRAYRIYFPLAALVALQMQAGLDGFLAVEKHLLVKRGLFRDARRRGPYAWEMDAETTAEVDRLFERLQQAMA
jgi:4-hydroxy-tetrahydrodipicolinate synthase